MAVLMEATNIIIRNSTIEEKYPGGLDEYIKNIPNDTFCSDGKITRIGFMVYDLSIEFIKVLEGYGFILEDESLSFKDICITRQSIGALHSCDWLICGKIEGMGYEFCALKGEEVTEDSIILPKGYKKDYKSDFKQSESSEYLFGFNGGDELFLIDGDVKYILCENENVPIKIFLKEYLPKDSDLVTYKNIFGPYSKDKNYVYLFGKIINGADPQTFKILSILNLIGSDKNFIYSGFECLVLSSVDTFKVLGSFQTDNTDIYLLGENFIKIKGPNIIHGSIIDNIKNISSKKSNNNICNNFIEIITDGAGKFYFGNNLGKNNNSNIIPDYILDNIDLNGINIFPEYDNQKFLNRRNSILKIAGIKQNNEELILENKKIKYKYWTDLLEDDVNNLLKLVKEDDQELIKEVISIYGYSSIGEALYENGL
ncbi:MAG: DKNYY domain-containing protein [Candidatus Gracilibacteria bacterium]|nr:DKNYY domain-containing protein [Candidatus Gracilibacteria bacterium]